MSSTSNWLIVGSSGFIGRSLVKYLLEQNCTVTALTIKSRGYHSGVPSVSIDDVCELKQLKPTVKFDYVVNLAAAGVNPSERCVDDQLETNIMLPVALLSSSSQLGDPTFFMAGSCSEYADYEGVLSEGARLSTASTYAASKAAASLITIATAKQLGVKCIWARLFNVLGPGESAHRLIPSLIKSYKNEQIFEMSDGMQVRDFMAVTDLVQIIYKLCVEHRKLNCNTSIMNISSNKGCTVRDIAKTACDAIGASDADLNIGAIPRRDGEVSKSIGDNRKLISTIGAFNFLPILDYVRDYSLDLFHKRKKP